MFWLIFRFLFQGIFYVDDTPAEEIAEQRKAMRASKARDNSIELNRKLWDLMKSGHADGTAFLSRSQYQYLYFFLFSSLTLSLSLSLSLFNDMIKCP